MPETQTRDEPSPTHRQRALAIVANGIIACALIFVLVRGLREMPRSFAPAYRPRLDSPIHIFDFCAMVFTTSLLTTLALLSLFGLIFILAKIIVRFAEWSLWAIRTPIADVKPEPFDTES